MSAFTRFAGSVLIQDNAKEIVLKQQQARSRRRFVRDAMVSGTLACTLAASFGVSSAHAHRAYAHRAQAYRADGGLASVYSGGRTASGEPMNSGALTAAHRTLPFGTRVTVVNNHTGRSVVVRINDRGPFVGGRVIDLSPAAAHAIGVSGLAPVSLRVVGGG
jgi:rare lipoprotein A